MKNINILEDLFKPNLKLVFCGTAAGNKSAKIGAYYAGRGNKFWKTLYHIGMVDKLIKPVNYNELLAYDIGLTDIAKMRFRKCTFASAVNHG